MHLPCGHLWPTEKQLPGSSMKKITVQEKRVLELIGEGHSTPQIADVLAISRHTVESHRKSLLLKLNARNAPELVRKAIQQNLLQLNNSDIQHNTNHDDD